MGISFKLNTKAFQTRLALYGPLCAVSILVTSLVLSQFEPKYTGICLEQHQVVLSHRLQQLYWILGIVVVTAMAAFVDIVTCVAFEAKRSMDAQRMESGDENQST